MNYHSITQVVCLFMMSKMFSILCHPDKCKGSQFRWVNQALSQTDVTLKMVLIFSHFIEGKHRRGICH